MRICFWEERHTRQLPLFIEELGGARISREWGRHVDDKVRCVDRERWC